MKVKIPTAVLESVIKSVKLRFYLTESNQSKLIKRLVELWMFIYNRQINDDTIYSLNGYTDIDKNELDRFSIQVNGKRFRYKQLLDIICDLVESNGKWSSGKFYTGYRIITSSFDNSLSEVDIDISKSFTILKSKEYWIKKYPNYSHLIEDCYKTSIQLSEYLNWMFDNEGMELKPIIKNGMVNKRYLNKDRIWKHFLLSFKINIGDLWFKISDEGRLYSSISNIPYTAIYFMRWNFQSVCDIDIKNCQPMLLSSFLGNCKGSLEYKLDVESGVFYDKMANELGISRDKFKILSYRFIFFAPKPLLSGKIYNAMEKLYSDVILKINDINSDGRLSHKLQLLESKIIVDVIGSLSIPKLLRHDQVICLKEHKEIVIKELLKEFKKLGLKPIINNN